MVQILLFEFLYFGNTSNIKFVDINLITLGSFFFLTESGWHNKYG